MPDRTEAIRFTDAAAYERYMGVWSQKAGATFLDWLAPAKGLRWLDVGCGNGAFTETIINTCAPSSVRGIDPAEAQIAHARARFAPGIADFQIGDAMALPFPDKAFDVAVMPLVIFFVPDPGKGVAEMARVVSAGGLVAAYAWDMAGRGFPYETLRDELRAMNLPVPQAPSEDASRLDVMHDLWTRAGLDAIETRAITVSRTYPDFDDYWTTILGAPSTGATLKALPPEQMATLKSNVRGRVSIQRDGRVVCDGTANAVKGRVSASSPGRRT